MLSKQNQPNRLASFQLTQPCFNKMRVSTKSLVYGTGGCFLGLLIGSYGLATPVSNVNNNVGNKLPISALNFSADKAGIMEGEAGIEKEGQTSTDTVICGGGPAGLLSAIMLAQKFPNVRHNIWNSKFELFVADAVLDFLFCFPFAAKDQHLRQATTTTISNGRRSLA